MRTEKNNLESHQREMIYKSTSYQKSCRVKRSGLIFTKYVKTYRL